MTTAHSSKKSSKKSAAHPTSTAEETTSTPAETPATTTALASVTQAPPAITLAAIPPSFVPVDMKYYSGILPKAAQLAVMAGAVQELKNFTDFIGVFGKTAPPQASVLQAFDIAAQWSSLHSKMTAYELFCASQEALSWKEVHDYMARLQPAFELAVKSDATVATEHPSLTRLFGAAKEIAAKGVATKKANKQLEAEGKPPIKGKAGKRRKTAAANALFEAATKGQTQSTAPAAPAAANGVTAATGAATSTGNGTGH
jgi:hypothetical protein